MTNYSIDTSAILHAWRRAYPPENFPSLWQELDKLIENGNLFATEEVLVELERQDDEVYDWAVQREEMFIPLDDDIQRYVQQILTSHKKLIDTRKNRSGADPFVIAVAHERDATVITNEKPTNSPSRPHIPDVCNDLNIPCTDILGLIKEHGWRM